MSLQKVEGIENKFLSASTSIWALTPGVLWSELRRKNKPHTPHFRIGNCKDLASQRCGGFIFGKSLTRETELGFACTESLGPFC
jgi:hypothetical protein